jgi:hypothetical protein
VSVICSVEVECLLGVRIVSCVAGMFWVCRGDSVMAGTGADGDLRGVSVGVGGVAGCSMQASETYDYTFK